MMDNEPRLSASRARRASVALTALAAVLLTCGATVEVTGNLLGPPANRSGSTLHPATTVQPTDPRSDLAEAPSPSCPPPTLPAYPSGTRKRPPLPP